MRDWPEINWRLPLEVVFDGENYPRCASLLFEHYRLDNGTTCNLVLIQEHYQSRTALYHHGGEPVEATQVNWVLRNKMHKVTRWYNLYTNGPGITYYNSHQEALDGAAGDRIATLSVDIEVPCEG
jgi:hypothetical protein